MRARLRNYVANIGISSPINVFVRTDALTEAVPLARQPGPAHAGRTP